jgi:transcriptional regulator with XRE-family HTH domain|tara:strand:- start:997 stop:1734 length:738 start_codon:yes stop_codon:yes gene_type:complete
VPRESTQLVTRLKQLLKARGLTYRDVARGLGLSESSVKRLFAARSFSLQRLEAICSLIDISISELVRLASDDRQTHTELSLQQETSLAADPTLLTFFYLIVAGWAPEEIVAEYEIETLESIRLLAALDRLGLIELLPGNRVRLLTSHNIEWLRKGPVRRAYERMAREEFLDSAFDKDHATFRALTGELSAESIVVMERKLKQLRASFEEMVDIDRQVPSDSKQSVGLMLALRPWVFSVLRTRQRK